VTVADFDDQTSDHLGRPAGEMYWDWSGESPVEIVLLIFVLVLFFTVPRTGCGIDNQKGQYPTRPDSRNAEPFVVDGS